jgi:hypothetical protein
MREIIRYGRSWRSGGLEKSEQQGGGALAVGRNLSRENATDIAIVEERGRAKCHGPTYSHKE